MQIQEASWPYLRRWTRSLMAQQHLLVFPGGDRGSRNKIPFCCCFRGKCRFVLCFYALNCVECWKNRMQFAIQSFMLHFFIGYWKHNAGIKDLAKIQARSTTPLTLRHLKYSDLWILILTLLMSWENREQIYGMYSPHCWFFVIFSLGQ